MKRHAFLAIVLLAIATTALASWYDDYNEGVKAVATGRWQVVIQKMTAAIAGNSKENDNARTYGNIFINYHPYYYRGLAYLRTGKYEQAISDFEKTSGPGEIDRGSIENLIQEAKMKQAAGNVGTTTTEPPPPPAIDPELRQRVNVAVNAAEQTISGARNRNAASAPQYQQAVTALVDAKQRATTAKTNDELRAALASAESAKTYADLATPPVIPPTPPTGTTSTTATAITTTSKPFVATGDVLRDTATRVRHALESYFSGEFDTASAQFTSLSKEMPKNGWIWAFLGASQYSQYAFEADEAYKSKAIQSFRKAKQYRTWKNGLPQKYFSRRIRKVFESAS